VIADDARDLAQSDHGLCWNYDWSFGVCSEPFTLYHPK
jgi:hypothetical protein